MCYYYSFHNKLKCNPAYLNSRVNRRVDYLITVLLRMEEDMFFDRQRKNLEWKRNSREVKEESRHDTGTHIPSSDIKVHVHIIKVHVHMRQLMSWVSFVYTVYLICQSALYRKWRKEYGMCRVRRDYQKMDIQSLRRMLHAQCHYAILSALSQSVCTCAGICTAVSVTTMQMDIYASIYMLFTFTIRLVLMWRQQ